ncbi:MAG: ThuA domain-containing protein [Acidobacteriota bacterium]|nr:ThuA domain-containing protein [Acidobacteriota bacterium]
MRSISTSTHGPILGSLTAPLLSAFSLSTLALTFLTPATAPAFAEEPLDVLLFTRAEGFVHGSISDGIAMIEDIAMEEQHTLTVTAKTDLFTAGSLAAFDVVVWLSTTGDVLDDPEQAAFEGFIQNGGGYVGIHAAADCEYDWPWYGDLLGNGAWFRSHPAIQTATLVLEDPEHPGAGFPDAMTSFEEEWYNFRANPRPAVNVLYTLDESSYDPGGGAMGDDHPIVWAHDFQGGRAFYTALGHRSQTYSDLRFKNQIRGAIRWAAGAVFSDGFESGDFGDWSRVEPGKLERHRLGFQKP